MWETKTSLREGWGFPQFNTGFHKLWFPFSRNFTLGDLISPTSQLKVILKHLHTHPVIIHNSHHCSSCKWMREETKRKYIESKLELVSWTEIRDEESTERQGKETANLPSTGWAPPGRITVPLWGRGVEASTQLTAAQPSQSSREAGTRQTHPPQVRTRGCFVNSRQSGDPSGSISVIFSGTKVAASPWAIADHQGKGPREGFSSSPPSLSICLWKIVIINCEMSEAALRKGEKVTECVFSALQGPPVTFWHHIPWAPPFLDVHPRGNSICGDQAFVHGIPGSVQPSLPTALPSPQERYLALQLTWKGGSTSTKDRLRALGKLSRNTCAVRLAPGEHAWCCCLN